MNKTRLEAFSDGVLAILITIMVLELKVPRDWSWEELHPTLETFSSYALSFVFLGIYWGNHHHLLHTVSRVTGAIMWANMHLLFWLSLIPFGNAWMGESGFESVPVAVYGAILLLSAISYTILSRTIQRTRSAHPQLSEVLHRVGLKEKLSMTLYLISIPLAFVAPLISWLIFVVVAIMWVIPNKEIEKVLNNHG